MSELQYPHPPGHRGVSTSAEAAAGSIETITARLQRMALRAIRASGSHGMTAEELAAALQFARTTVQPRTSELRRLHLIGDSGERRFNGSGRRAIVWTATRQREMAA